MKFKGHTKIELTDVETGEVKTVESDNFMTNALQKYVEPIFCLDWPHRLNFSDTYSDSGGNHFKNLIKFFGGLYLYDTNLGNSANLLFAPSGVKLTGHGTNVTYSGSDLSMGSYNSSLSGKYLDDDEKILGYKFVWDFTQEQGNGDIAAACLTTKWGGYITQGSKFPLEAAGVSLNDYEKRTCQGQSAYFYRTRHGFAPNGYGMPYGTPYIDTANNCYYSFESLEEFINANRYRSDNVNFQASLIYKKSVTITKYRFPCTSWSMFDITGSCLDAYSTAERPSIESITKLGTYTVQMPNELKTIIDTALNRGASWRFNITSPCISNSGNVYIPIIINEGDSAASYGQRPGEHFYIWKIHFTDLTSSYYAVTNTANENIGAFQNQFAYSSDYSWEYCLEQGPSIVNDKWLFALGYTSHKGYLIELSNSTNIKTVKDAKDETTDFVFGTSTYFKRGTCIGEKTLVANLGYTSSWTGRINNNVSTAYNGLVIDGELGLVEYVNALAGDWWPGQMRSYAPTVQYNKQDALMFTAAPDNYNTNNNWLSVFMIPQVLMTINNLDTPVTKTTAQTMRVTYIVDFEEEEE